MPDAGEIEEFREPIVQVNFVLPTENIGADDAAVHRSPRRCTCAPSISRPTRAMLTYDLPLAEVIYDLHDKLKSVTRGYGTMDYELLGYRPADLVRLDILVSGKRVDALSIICDRRDADRRGRAVVKKLAQRDRPAHVRDRRSRPRSAAAIIARETISAMRKNVTAKCYGGDITRKRKLWAKQKEGKKRMKSIGRSTSRRRRSWRCSKRADRKSNGYFPRRLVAGTIDDMPRPRRIIEWTVLAVILAVAVRTFCGQWQVVVSASMADTLVGPHYEVTCADCGYAFQCDADPPLLVRAVCPNCGYANERLGEIAAGDQLWVDRAAFYWHAPERWDVVVFHSPDAAGEPTVKRIVGLPGETIEVRDGEVFADGRIVRKPLDVARRWPCWCTTRRFRPAAWRPFPPAGSRRMVPRGAPTADDLFCRAANRTMPPGSSTAIGNGCRRGRGRSRRSQSATTTHITRAARGD